MTNKKENPYVVENRLLTSEEVMEILQISRSKFNSLLKNGELKGIKLGRRWKLTKENIEHFINGEPQE